MRIRPDQQLIRAALTCLLCLGASLASAQARLEVETNLIWKQDEPWFGGWSGAELSSNGHALTVISDKGRLLTARLSRDNGRLTGLAVQSSRPLLNPRRAPLTGKRTDAEGLAIAPDGRAFVSFEHVHRVMRLDLATGRTSALRRLPDTIRLQLNSGLEALAISPDGALFALPERSGEKARPFPLYRLTDTGWQIAAHIPRRGPFLPVGADFDAEGRLWLLERTATPLGFRSRIRRFDLDAPDLGEIRLASSGPGRFDNLEAITVWQDAGGVTRVLTLSDDNFLSIQRTQLVEFILTE